MKKVILKSSAIATYTFTGSDQDADFSPASDVVLTLESLDDGSGESVYLSAIEGFTIKKARLVVAGEPKIQADACKSANIKFVLQNGVKSSVDNTVHELAEFTLSMSKYNEWEDKNVVIKPSYDMLDWNQLVRQDLPCELMAVAEDTEFELMDLDIPSDLVSKEISVFVELELEVERVVSSSKVEPLVPAANTLRFLFSKPDYDPTVAGVGSSGTWKKLDRADNVWDWTCTNLTNGLASAFVDPDNLVEVIAAGDTSARTSIRSLFNACTSLVKCVLFDTSNVTTFYSAFNGCTNLKHIPLFDTSKVETVAYAFNGCVKVESGAKALYDQMSTQTTPPATTTNCFTNCGKDTTTGAAELAQIPASWGGTMPEPEQLNLSSPLNLSEPLFPSVEDSPSIDEEDNTLTM